MTINKWYYSNLNSRPDKIHSQELVAAIQGFPSGVLERFPAAIENEDIPDKKDLCQLIQRDGFPEWSYELLRSAMSETWLAANWTKLRILRHVAEGDSGAVITTDNAYAIVPFSVIETVLSQCPKDLKALYLHWVADPYRGAFDFIHYKALAGLTPIGVSGVLGNFRGVGWIAYWTPEGAKDFLDIWKSIPYRDGQEVLVYAESLANLIPQGYYVCNPHLALSVFDMQRILGNDGVISNENPLYRKDK